MTLAMVLAVFPAVPALAAAPTTVEVAGTDVSGGGYWKTNADGKLEEGTQAEWNVCYQSGTLYLQNAHVSGAKAYGVDNAGAQAVIYANGGGVDDFCGWELFRYWQPG